MTDIESIFDPFEGIGNKGQMKESQSLLTQKKAKKCTYTKRNYRHDNEIIRTLYLQAISGVYVTAQSQGPNNMKVRFQNLNVISQTPEF